MRDVNGTGFALYFVSQMMGQVALTGLAVAAGSPAFSAEGDEAGGDERAVEFELPNARGEVPADQGGVGGCFHRLGW